MHKATLFSCACVPTISYHQCGAIQMIHCCLRACSASNQNNRKNPSEKVSFQTLFSKPSRPFSTSRIIRSHCLWRCHSRQKCIFFQPCSFCILCFLLFSCLSNVIDFKIYIYVSMCPKNSQVW